MTVCLASTEFQVRFYMPRIDHADLMHLIAVAEYLRPRAATFADWVLSVLQGERLRRFAAFGSGIPTDVEFPSFVVEEWSSEALASAITITHEFCYETWHMDVAKFWDAVAYAFTQAAALRLLEGR